MPNLEDNDPVEINAASDASRIAQIGEAMTQMIELGSVTYVDSDTHEVRVLKFETVISEGCDTEGFIPSMFEFFRAHGAWKKIGFGIIEKARKGDLFILEIEKLLTHYIIGDVINDRA